VAHISRTFRAHFPSQIHGPPNSLFGDFVQQIFHRNWRRIFISPRSIQSESDSCQYWCHRVGKGAVASPCPVVVCTSSIFIIALLSLITVSFWEKIGSRSGSSVDGLVGVSCQAMAGPWSGLKRRCVAAPLSWYSDEVLSFLGNEMDVSHYEFLHVIFIHFQYLPALLMVVIRCEKWNIEVWVVKAKKCVLGSSIFSLLRRQILTSTITV
jgi:hypothetical protein